MRPSPVRGDAGGAHRARLPPVTSHCRRQRRGAVLHPGGERTQYPSIIAVGRLAPVKRFGLLLDAAFEAKQQVPDLRLRIVGDGPTRPQVVQWIAEHHAADWVELAGRLTHEALRNEYRRAWIVASASLAEGGGCR